MPLFNNAKIHSKVDVNNINNIKISRKSRGSAKGKILDYSIKEINSKALIKDAPLVSVARNIVKLPQNTNYYEVAIADLMEKLGLRAVKKIPFTEFEENPNERYVASLWEEGLKNYASGMLWKGKISSVVSAFLPVQSKVSYWVKLYKSAENPNQKELYKMCACLVASGMTDLKIGDNIKEDEEGRPIAVDTGFQVFTAKVLNYTEKDWQECINILKNNEDKEVQKWGEEIQKFKNFCLEYVEKKPNIRHEVNLSKFNEMPEEHLLKLPQKTRNSIKISQKERGLETTKL